MSLLDKILRESRAQADVRGIPVGNPELASRIQITDDHRAVLEVLKTGLAKRQGFTVTTIRNRLPVRHRITDPDAIGRLAQDLVNLALAERCDGKHRVRRWRAL